MNGDFFTFGCEGIALTSSGDQFQDCNDIFIKLKEQKKKRIDETPTATPS